MRKLIIKYFALSYRFDTFGTEHSIPRAATIIYPALVLSMLPYFMYAGLTVLTVSVLSWIYITKFPAGYNEMDNEQQEMYHAKKSGGFMLPLQYNYRAWMIIFNPFISAVISLVVIAISWHFVNI